MAISCLTSIPASAPPEPNGTGHYGGRAQIAGERLLHLLTAESAHRSRFRGGRSSLLREVLRPCRRDSRHASWWLKPEVTPGANDRCTAIRTRDN